MWQMCSMVWWYSWRNSESSGWLHSSSSETMCSLWLRMWELLLTTCLHISNEVWIKLLKLSMDLWTRLEKCWMVLLSSSERHEGLSERLTSNWILHDQRKSSKTSQLPLQMHELNRLLLSMCNGHSTKHTHLRCKTWTKLHWKNIWMMQLLRLIEQDNSTMILKRLHDLL